MPTNHSTLSSQAFGALADSSLIVAYQAHQDALRFLSSAMGGSTGVAIIQGPTGSGKTTVVKEQSTWLSREASVAFLSGEHLTPRQLLTGMLRQFGVRCSAEPDEHLLQLLNTYVSKQAERGAAPILVIDGADSATPSGLRLLNWLAALEVRDGYALRIVLTVKSSFAAILKTDSMRSLRRRHPATYSLNPMSLRETVTYLRTRLIAAGVEHSEKILPLDVCENLHKLSNGWPGALNRVALESITLSDELLSTRSNPRIIVSRDGEMVAEHELTERQYLIGRTTLSDIVIPDTYVSKLHAMVQVYANALLLIDLNSTNGTTINSRVMEKSVLRSDDIISLGRYRLKVENAPAIDNEMDERLKSSDTMTMQTLVDMRRDRARKTVKALKSK